MKDDKLQEIIELLPYSIRYSGEIEELLDYAREQAERVQELEETVEYYKTVNKELHQRGRKLRKQNKRYREVIEYIKLELKDFRKDAITIKKLSRDRIVQNEAFSLSCDIRDCLKALEGEEK